MLRIGQQQLLRGAALADLIDTGLTLEIKRWVSIHEALYTMKTGQNKSMFLVKTSTTPKRWQFTFTEAELAAITSRSITITDKNRYFALVCKTDGVCCLPLLELAPLLEGVEADAKFVSVSRPRGGRYHISGPRRSLLSRTIPANDWPRRVTTEQQ